MKPQSTPSPSVAAQREPTPQTWLRALLRDIQRRDDIFALLAEDDPDALLTCLAECEQLIRSYAALEARNAELERALDAVSGALLSVRLADVHADARRQIIAARALLERQGV